MHREKTIKQARLIPQTLASWTIEKLKQTKKTPQARINSEFIGIHAVTEWCKSEPDRTRTVGPYDLEHRHIFFIS